jgi:hypothetical protein
MEPEEELHSFPYDATIGGRGHHYRVTENQGIFGIEEDGVVIATIERKAGNWTQVSGEPLGKELLNSICDHIESQ